MDQIKADLVVKWYIELEGRLLETLKITLYTPETENIFLPPLSNVLLDACSLLDAIFREEFVGSINRRDLSINNYCTYFESQLSLSTHRTIIYQYPLLYIQPFKGWLSPSGSYQQLEWWMAYNKIKHDRILEYKRATLKNTVQCLCALHQVVSLSRTFLDALIRHDFVSFGNWGKEYAKEAIYQTNNDQVTLIVETDLFATPVGAKRFPENTQNISPYHFSFGKKLWRFVGREH